MSSNSAVTQRKKMIIIGGAVDFKMNNILGVLSHKLTIQVNTQIMPRNKRNTFSKNNCLET